MSKKTGHKVDLSEYVERKINEGAIEITAGDEKFVVPPAELWPDELSEYRGDLVKQAECIMGAEVFARFKAAGGTANLLDAIIKDTHGADAGK